MIEYLKKIGDVKAYSASEVQESRVGIGFEKLDRAVFNPEKAYDPVSKIGVKWIRIVSGWQRTETAPGEYHFQWLDDVVDNLRSRGLRPWMTLIYGNKIYDQDAAVRFGGVGCPPNSPELLPHWIAYIKALVAHFTGRIQWWEVWNEPDCKYSWRGKANLTEYCAFAKATADAIREVDPNAKIIWGALSGASLDRLQQMFLSGVADSMDAISFHTYTYNEASDDLILKNLKKMVALYCPKLEIIQGEGGCQSRHDGAGAMSGMMFTQEKQRKQMARHLIQQLGAGCKFVSYFSSLDMIEALNGTVDNKASYLDYGYFGVMGADFDENGIATGNYRPKPSYRTLQVIASLFKGDVHEVDDVPYQDMPTVDSRFGIASYMTGNYYDGAAGDTGKVFMQAFRRDNGAVALAYWVQSDLMRETYEGSFSFMVTNVPRTSCKLVDVVDGSIYEMPEDCIELNSERGVVKVKKAPIFDRPMLICFGDFVD